MPFVLDLSFFGGGVGGLSSEVRDPLSFVGESFFDFDDLEDSVRPRVRGSEEWRVGNISGANVCCLLVFCKSSPISLRDVSVAIISTFDSVVEVVGSMYSVH
jgi:hypothetical protein